MGIAKTVKDCLDRHRIGYVHSSHPSAFTAQEVAAATHVPGKEFAKTVIVKADGRYVMVVLPASHKIEFEKLRRAIGAETVELASEEEFAELFPDCEVGAMPPLGNLYGLPVYVSSSLAEDEEIVFNAGTHTDVIRMKYSDFSRLVSPEVGEFSEHV